MSWLLNTVTRGFRILWINAVFSRIMGKTQYSLT